MKLTNSALAPHLSVQVVVDAPENELGVTDRFLIKGDDEMVERFITWWATLGVVRLAETLAAGYSFYLVDDGDGSRADGSFRAIGEYLSWRDETLAELELGLAEEPALAVAA